MRSASRKLLEEALSLPDDERREVAECLLDTILRDDPGEVAAAWADEAVRRAGALEAGDAEAVDGERAVSELEAKLRNRQGG